MAKKLSLRLSTVAAMVDGGCFLADIGSDHAYLPIYLVSTGKIQYAMAVENKMGPFLQMKKNIDDSGLSNRIIVSNSDGISKISDEVNCLAICGMGGLLSCEILEAHPEKIENVSSIIMDPHRDLKSVRERVTALGYRIADEKMIKEDKTYYSIIKFIKGHPKRAYTQAELCFGPILLEKKDPTFVEWMELQKKKVSDILNKNLSKQAREAYLEIYRLIANELKRMNANNPNTD